MDYFNSGFSLDSTSAFGGVLNMPDQSTSSGDFWSGLASGAQTIGGLISSAADAYARVKGGSSPENTYRTYGSPQATESYGVGTPQPGAGGNGAVMWMVLGAIGVVLLFKYGQG